MLATFLSILLTVLEVYFFILIAYILLSWFPTIRESRFYYYLHRIADPYMRFFRGFLVIGSMDFTPIVGFLIYRFGLYAFAEFVASL